MRKREKITSLIDRTTSDFTDEIATRICDLLMDGLSMRSICQADDMPHRTTGGQVAGALS